MAVADLAGRDLVIEYESIGHPDDPVLLLVGGLTQQLIEWHDGLCAEFAAQGLRVIRFDNRDCGLSTQLDHLGVPDVSAVLAGRQGPPYALSDIAADAVVLLDFLQVPSGHIMGNSMGGMVAQLMAISHPTRVDSLISCGSTCRAGDTDLDISATASAFASVPVTREERVEDSVAAWKWMNGDHYQFDEQDARLRAQAKDERSAPGPGRLRQLAAMAAAGDRTDALRGVRVPTLVLHGLKDPVISVAGGVVTAEAVPGSHLRIFDGMGHGIPRVLWGEIAALVGDHARSVRNIPKE